MELKNGTPLAGGKYRIEKKLGQGSFGITYLAAARFTTHSSLGDMTVDAKVAVKEFFMGDINSRREDGSTVEGSQGSVFTNYRKRFRKEAENLMKLSHPNIVKVFDVFDENNTTYYVMEYLGNSDLNSYIRHRNGLAEEECIRFTKQIGGALQYMHDSMMLHLDLKPGNVMLRGNEAILIDFGLSKQFNADGHPETSTTIGQGTPGYAPLEQSNYKGRNSTDLPVEMDVYALGATMFKMITGITPPDASSVLNDGLPVNELKKKGVSAKLLHCIVKAMASMKKDRYGSVSQLLSDLSTGKDEIKTKESESTVYAKESDEDNISTRNFYAKAHLLAVGVTAYCFFTEHVYRGCESPRGAYPDTFVQTVYQALTNWSQLEGLVAIALCIIGFILLISPYWTKSNTLIVAFIGAVCLGVSSFMCELFGSCNFDNMLWILFMILSLINAWIISSLNPKTNK